MNKLVEQMDFTHVGGNGKKRKILRPQERKRLWDDIGAHYDAGHITRQGRLDLLTRKGFERKYGISRSQLYKEENEFARSRREKAYGNLEKEEVEAIKFMMPSPEERDKDLKEQREWNLENGAIAPSAPRNVAEIDWGPLAKDIGQLMGMVKRAEREAREAKEEVKALRKALAGAVRDITMFYRDMPTMEDHIETNGLDWAKTIGGEDGE